MMRSLRVFWALVACITGAARAQTMHDQEQRLIEVHSLLLALPTDTAPGALGPLEISLGVEAIGVPTINGQTGGRIQFTASDRTFAVPRPRLALGLPAPDGFRAFIGFSYIPPITVLDIKEHFGALEGGLAWVPGPLTIGVRGYVLVARSQTPVTDPVIRDTLDNFEFGGDLSAGYRFDLGTVSVTPFAGAGLARVRGSFRVTTDDVVLTSTTINPSITGGVRFFARPGLDLSAELVAYPGVLVHPNFRFAWVFDWWAKHK